MKWNENDLLQKRKDWNLPVIMRMEQIWKRWQNLNFLAHTQHILWRKADCSHHPEHILWWNIVVATSWCGKKQNKKKPIAESFKAEQGCKTNPNLGGFRGALFKQSSEQWNIYGTTASLRRVCPPKLTLTLNHRGIQENHWKSLKSCKDPQLRWENLLSGH